MIRFAAALVVVLSAAAALAQNAMTVGKLVPEPPTLTCLGVCWYITGDENYNATGQLSYRKAGEEAWHKALPLFRVDPRKLHGDKQIEPMLAGSVFDLEPDTEYELKVRISDPDGGEAEQTLKQRTRAVPQTPKGAREVHVVPGDGGGSGTQDDPFKGLPAAARTVRPGDLVLIHAGTYQGPIHLPRSGEPGKPITYRGAGDGEAIIEGKWAAEGEGDGLVIYGTKHLIFERLTVRNGYRGFSANGCQDLTVRRCTITGNRFGVRSIAANNPGKDFYIADNVIRSTCTWPRSKGIEDIEGIEICGTGHVVCHNRISNCGDDFSFREPASACDIYNNILETATDDAVELDESFHNARCFRNRITNCFMGISAQPVWGGPAYVFRNVLFNMGGSPFKLHNEPSGLFLFHNTCIRSGQALQSWGRSLRHIMARDDLFFGNDRYSIEFGGAAGTMEMVDMDFDYNGYARSSDPARFIKWKGVAYPSLEALRDGAGIERHGILVALDIFAATIEWPTAEKLYEPPDLRLKAGCAAIDAGEALPNVNDGFQGKAPDLGAYELGDKLPVYGPRPE